MTTAQIDAAFKEIAKPYIQTAMGSGIGCSDELVALTSVAFNGLYGPGLQTALNLSDPYAARAEAWYQIRYAHLEGQNDKRRHIEAAIFGLYEPGTVTLEEAAAVYQMFTGHRTAMIDYDKTYTQTHDLVNQANLDITMAGFSERVQDLKGELTSAATLLMQEYGHGRTDFNPLNIQMASEEPILGYSILKGEYDTDRTGSADDLLIGSKTKSNLLDGGGGNDILIGGDFDDILMGGSGSDKLYGGEGKDKLYADSGEGNYLYGEGGDDILFGCAGTNYLYGGTGHDTYFAYDGNIIYDVDAQKVGNIYSWNSDIFFEGEYLTGGYWDTQTELPFFDGGQYFIDGYKVTFVKDGKSLTIYFADPDNLPPGDGQGGQGGSSTVFGPSPGSGGTSPPIPGDSSDSGSSGQGDGSSGEQPHVPPGDTSQQDDDGSGWPDIDPGNSDDDGSGWTDGDPGNSDDDGSGWTDGDQGNSDDDGLGGGLGDDQGGDGSDGGQGEGLEINIDPLQIMDKLADL